MKRFNYVVTLFVLLLSFTATAAEQIYFVQTDHLGAPEMLTDENQTIVWQASQDPFANSAPIIEQVTFDFRFPGQYYDAESGLFYNWNRYYDAGTGRYVTSDPIGLNGGLNTFGYVLGNPLRYSDPTGELVQVVEVGVAALVLYGACYFSGVCNMADPMNPPGWGDDWPIPTWPDGEGPEWVDPDDLTPMKPSYPGDNQFCPDGPDEDCEEARKIGMAMCESQPVGVVGACKAMVIGMWIACLFKESDVGF